MPVLVDVAVRVVKPVKVEICDCNDVIERADVRVDVFVDSAV